MSSRSGSGGAVGADDVTEALQESYHYLVLAVLMGFMLGVRLIPLDRFTGQESIQLQAVDSYYHWRTTEWTVQNYPFTMPYDIFTGYPTGTYVGQFGTLFDQMIATVALIIGLGNPSESDILLAALIGVPIIAMLIAIPVYKIGERLGGRLAGLVGVAILALAPGQFLTRSTAGMFQHHAAEALFMAITVFAMMVAIRVAEREKPVYELLVDRDWDALRRPALYSAAAGLSMALYVWVWPPAVVLIGILGVFFVVAITIDHVRGVPPEPIAFVGAVSLGVAGLLTLLLMEDPTGTSVTDFSLLQPLVALMVAAGCIFLAGLSRLWYLRDLREITYPGGVAASIAVGLLFLALVLPDLYGTLIGNLTGRLIPIDPSVTGLTVSEARPPPDPAMFMFEEFGFAFYTMILGLVVMAGAPFVGQRYRTEHTLIIVWSLFLISMGLTQIRFNYYLVLAVAVVNAYLVGIALQWFDLTTFASIKSIKGYQVLSLLLVVVILFVPLMPPVAAVSAMDVSQNAWPSSDGQTWEEANLFLYENTPKPGDWGDHSNSDQIDYFGTYDNPGSDGYDYPPGTYGVMTWWDYGHLITTQAERIPHANPFQQNARSAANFLLADSEETANMVLDAIAATGDGVSTNDPEELEAILADYDGESTHDIRYVMVEDQMVGGKFWAKTQWTGDGTAMYQEADFFELGETGQNETLPTVNDNYWNTFLVQLYRNDGQGLEHYRLVHETEQVSLVGGIAMGDSLMPADSLRLQGTWADFAELDGQLGQAARQNLAVQLGPGILAWDAGIYPSVKTFERVEGATLTGTVEDPNQTVLIQLNLRTNADREFTYVTYTEPDEDGNWEITVPYATSNDLGPEDGYTDSAVEALGPYHVMATDNPGLVNIGFALPDHEAHVNVSEEAIYQGLEFAVELEEVDQPARFEVESMDAPDVVNASETFDVTATINNTGDLAGEGEIELYEGDELIANETIELEGGETTTVTFDHAIDEDGEYVLSIVTPHDSATHDIVVGDVEVENGENDNDGEETDAKPAAVRVR